MRYPLQDANVSVFKSASPQRPISASFVPSSAHYTPNPYSILPAPGNPGASMKGQGDRSWMKQAQFKSQTDEIVGPGTYEGAELDQTLMQDCRDHMKRASKMVRSVRVDLAAAAGLLRAGSMHPHARMPMCAQLTHACVRRVQVRSFESTSPQRPGFFMNPGQSPDVAPGCYEPLEPRLKDLKAQGGDAWRQVM